MKLQPQPAKILAALIRRAGEIVTRQELAAEVWGSDTFVDYEQGLNFAIRQIRTVPEDDADHPQFIETLPPRGYRFIAPLSEPAARPEGAEPLMETDAGPMRTAYQYGALKNADKTLQYLDRADREQNDQLVLLEMKNAPEFVFLRGDPRYLDLLRRLGLQL